MKRDHKIKKSWRQLEIVFPVQIAPPTFVSPQAAYDFFTKHEDEFPEIEHKDPELSDMDSAVAEFGQDSLDVMSGLMSFPWAPALPGARDPSLPDARDPSLPDARDPSLPDARDPDSELASEV